MRPPLRPSADGERAPAVGTMAVKLCSVFVLVLARLTRACYKFPADVADPCLEKRCEWGAECRPTLDGRGADCVCPDKCVSYGDARGSRPVCGSDGRDYPNSCELRRAACNAMRDVQHRFTGPCGKWDTRSCAFLQRLHAEDGRIGGALLRTCSLF